MNQDTSQPNGSNDADRIVVSPEQRTPFFAVCKRLVLLFVFLPLVIPRLLIFWCCRMVLGSRAFSGASESIARIPGMRGVFMRQMFYRQILDRCGHDNYFGWNSAFSMTEARVGNRVYIGRFCSIGYANLEDDVMLADGVQILSGGHEHGTKDDAAHMSDQPQSFEQVTVGEGAWIGAGAIVMADVGARSIVGAGAVVNKPIPPRSVAVGVPAKTIRSE